MGGGSGPVRFSESLLKLSKAVWLRLVSSERPFFPSHTTSFKDFQITDSPGLHHLDNLQIAPEEDAGPRKGLSGTERINVSFTQVPQGSGCLTQCAANPARTVRARFRLPPDTRHLLIYFVTLIRLTRTKRKINRGVPRQFSATSQADVGPSCCENSLCQPQRAALFHFSWACTKRIFLQFWQSGDDGWFGKVVQRSNLIWYVLFTGASKKGGNWALKLHFISHGKSEFSVRKFQPKCCLKSDSRLRKSEILTNPE